MCDLMKRPVYRPSVQVKGEPFLLLPDFLLLSGGSSGGLGQQRGNGAKMILVP